MKTLKCDACSFEGSGETFEEWMKVMYDHNIKDHPEMMKEMMAKPPEEGEKWRAAARAKFDAGKVK